MKSILVMGFDLETSGVSVHLDRPVQLGLVMRIYENGSHTDYPVINMLCNPGKPIDPGAAAIHGISDAQVANTPSAYDAVDYLAKTVAYYAQGREAYVCTYNGYSFDVPMANNTLSRQAFTNPHIDVLRMVRHKFPEVRGALGDPMRNTAPLARMPGSIFLSCFRFSGTRGHTGFIRRFAGENRHEPDTVG